MYPLAKVVQWCNLHLTQPFYFEENLKDRLTVDKNLAPGEKKTITRIRAGNTGIIYPPSLLYTEMGKA